LSFVALAIKSPMHQWSLEDYPPEEQGHRRVPDACEQKEVSYSTRALLSHKGADPL